MVTSVDGPEIPDTILDPSHSIIDLGNVGGELELLLGVDVFPGRVCVVHQGVEAERAEVDGVLARSASMAECFVDKNRDVTGAPEFDFRQLPGAEGVRPQPHESVHPDHGDQANRLRCDQGPDEARLRDSSSACLYGPRQRGSDEPPGKKCASD